MNIIAHRLEIAAARPIHNQRLEAAGKQMPNNLCRRFQPAGLSAQKPFHPCDQIGLECREDQMKMIGLEDAGVNLPARFGARLAEGLDEALPIRLIVERGSRRSPRFMT